MRAGEEMYRVFMSSAEEALMTQQRLSVKVRLLRATALLACVWLAGCKPETAAFLPEYPVLDLLIENGTVFDGLGESGVIADIAVVGDSIVFIGEVELSAAEMAARVLQRIDASGKVVTPGFIDLHSHGDPLQTPDMESFLAMGVTTISLGQDGDSPDVEPLSDWLAEVSATGIGTNLAMFVGHGTLRNQSGIGMARPPEPEAMARMLSLLDDTLDYTFGLSSGLEYNPGLNADVDELRALARVVGENDRLIMSHMRNEDDDQLDASIAELLIQGERTSTGAGTRVHIAHLKSVYGSGAERAVEILEILKTARDAGIRVTADVYPYTASYTGIDIVFPVWAKTQAQFEVARIERREELAEYLRAKIARRNGPQATLFGTDPYTGKTLADLSREMELPFEDVLIDVIGPQGASGAYFVMNEELQARLLEDPYIGICSDGSPTGFHPRGHGTFAKIIEKYVVQEKVLSLAEAIRKMTAFPAQVLGITDRGAIKVGMIADLIVFDPGSVRATASYPEPLQFAEGFDVVVVNGHIAREKGQLSGGLSGRVLLPQKMLER